MNIAFSTDNNTKISALIPVYNVEKYIERCLISLFENTIAEDIEFVIVNDCSTDSSMEILNQLIHQHQNLNIKIINHEKNAGLATARNTGIKNATSKYVCFIDSDDYVEKNYFETLLTNIEKDISIDCVCCKYFIEDDHNKTISDDFENNINNHFLDLVSDNIKAYMWNKIYKLEIIKNNNLHWLDGVNYLEDYLFNIQYFSCAKKITYINTPLYHYIQRPNSYVSSSKSLKIASDIFTVMNFAKDYISKSEFNDDKNIKEELLKRMLEMKTRIVINGSFKMQRLYSNSWKETKTIADTAKVGKLSKLILKSNNKLSKYFLCFINSILLILKGNISLKYYFS